jgi:hypothetical protein
MEKETHAPTEKETTEKTGTLQVSLLFNNFQAYAIPSFWAVCHFRKLTR